MATKSILLAIADPQELAEITQALGAVWETVSVASEVDALTQLESRAFDVLLVDFNLGSPDASELLNQALVKRPETVRFVLAYEADLALIAAKVEGSPNILPKPVEPASIKTRIESAVSESDPEPARSDQPGAGSDSPTIPAIYSEVLKALELPDATSKQVGQLIAKDRALTSEVLRLTNSTHLGLPRNITDPGEAVESLGLETVKALVQALQFLAEHSRLKPGYFSIDQIWQHSVNVGQIARDLVLFETKDRTLASQALIAGLVHDLGKIVLATNFDDLYGRVHSLARKQPVALYDIEKEMFGASHGEIGACLLGMWNLPGPIIDAAAMHHEPQLSQDQQLTPLAAVHIANILEHELQPGEHNVMVSPIVNTPFLNQLGLLQRLPIWRAAFANRRSENFESEDARTESEQTGSNTLLTAEASRTGNYLRGPAASTQTGTSGHPGNPNQRPTPQRTWAYASVAIAVLLLLVVWLETEPDLNTSEPAYARTPASSQTPAPVTVASAPAREMASAESAAAGPSSGAAQESAASPASTPVVLEPAASMPMVTPSSAVVSTPASALRPSAPEAAPNSSPVHPSTSPEPTLSGTPRPEVTNVSAPVVPQQKTQPEFRLNAIFYTTVRPSAILNGATVNVGDELNGATVLAITRTAVTLLVNGQRRTFELR